VTVMFFGSGFVCYPPATGGIITDLPVLQFGFRCNSLLSCFRMQFELELAGSLFKVRI